MALRSSEAFRRASCFAFVSLASFFTSSPILALSSTQSSESLAVLDADLCGAAACSAGAFLFGFLSLPRCLMGSSAFFLLSDLFLDVDGGLVGVGPFFFKTWTLPLVEAGIVSFVFYDVLPDRLLL